MVAVIEASFRTALMAGFGTLHRAPAGLGPAACRAVGVATVARRTDRKEAVAPAAGLLAKGLVHGVGGPGRPPTGRRNPNRGTTLPTGSVCRRARRSRGSGGPVRTLTFVCGPSVRYPKHRGNTTAGAMDAAAGVDAHDAPTPACETTRRAVSHKRPQSILFVLIKNPEELRDRTDATIRVQTSSLSRGRRHYPGFPTLFWGLSVFFVGDLMGKALWKLVENAARFPRRGGRVLCVHGAVSFHRARPCGPRWLPRTGE